MDWQPIETAPKDGSTIKAHHSNAADMGVNFAPNAKWDGTKWQMSCYPFSKCGRFLITGQPDLWQPTPQKEQTP